LRIGVGRAFPGTPQLDIPLNHFCFETAASGPHGMHRIRPKRVVLNIAPLMY